MTVVYLPLKLRINRPDYGGPLLSKRPSSAGPSMSSVCYWRSLLNHSVPGKQACLNTLHCYRVANLETPL